jgi:hypothetical protein
MELYVHVSADGTYLTNPIHGIVRAELVSATVARTFPTIFDGDTITVMGTFIQVPEGFYDQASLIAYINQYSSVTGVTFKRQPFSFKTQAIYSVALFDALSGTSNVMSILGFNNLSYSTTPVGSSDPKYQGSYMVISENPGLQTQPTQVFLDIEELKHPYMNGYFATFPFDVPNGSIMVFNESSDCKCFIEYDRPLDRIHRITPRWFDQYRTPLQISGEFLLRLYCKDDRPCSVPVRRF